MLDVQKERVFHNRPEIEFAKKTVAALSGTAWIAPALLLFHEMFFWSILMVVWFLLVVSVIPSFKKGRDWARLFLGGLCLIGTAITLLVASYGNVLFMHGADPLLGDEALLKWAYLWCAGIFIIGITLLLSRRVKKATNLWSTFK